MLAQQAPELRVDLQTVARWLVQRHTGHVGMYATLFRLSFQQGGFELLFVNNGGVLGVRFVAFWSIVHLWDSKSQSDTLYG